MHNSSQIFHESEVSSHAVGESGHLAELRDQGDFVPGLSILVDEERLVGVGDVLIVPRLVVLLVAGLYNS